MTKGRWVALALVMVFMLALVGGVIALFSKLAFPAGRIAQRNTATLITQVQGLSQLVTVKYIMEKVVVLEDVKLWGENRILLVAHGVVKAGVNLSELRPEDLEIRGQEITIRLPRAAITDCYLDEEKTQVVEHTTGLLRRFDKSFEQTARRKGIEAIRQTAQTGGILDDADERAELQLQVLMRTLGFEQVVIQR